MMKVTSIGQRLDDMKGFGPGFDFMRIFLAMGVLVTHAANLVVGDGLTKTPWWFFEFSILPMFFALSGFLVTASAIRLSLPDFLVHRGARIIPALLVEITLSALVLGPLLTNLPLREYFSDPQFFIYFLNIVGVVQYHLPGVFTDNPVAQYQGVVNRSIWTIPHEIFCYIVISVAMYIGVFRKQKTAIAFFATIAVAYVGFSFLRWAPLPDAARDVVLSFVDQVRALLPFFIIGSAIYLLRYKIPFDYRIFACCLAYFLLMSFVGQPGFASKFGMRPLNSFVFTYMIIFLGLTPLPRLPLFSRGDYSYGVYLYGFPLQQAILQVFPFVKSLWTFIPLSIIAATAMAIFSWHVIEKPALRVRKSLSLTMKNHGASKTEPFVPALSDASGQKAET